MKMTVRIASIQFVLLAFLVFSSPIVIFMNPVLAVTKGNTVDTSNNHATVTTSSSLPLNNIAGSSPSSTVGTPTIQAALGGLTVRPTNDIVGTKAFYDIVFVTGESGVVKRVVVSFPGGTGIPTTAFLNEVEGLGPGTVTKSGTVLTYTVNNAVNVPAGTKIRLEFANIINPLNPNTNYKVSIITRNAANEQIDGPTRSTAYAMKQIGTGKIADNSITSTKPSEGFMKRVTLLPGSNTHGWNPNGVVTKFFISEPNFIHLDRSIVFLTLNDVPTSTAVCAVNDSFPISGQGSFTVTCSTPPTSAAELNYVIVNLSDHLNP